MQYWTINNKFITSRYFTGWMYGLLMMMVTPVIAGNAAVDNEGSQYPALRVAEQSNPWVLPQKQESHPGFQPGSRQQPYDYYQQPQPAPMGVKNPGAQNPDAQRRYRQYQRPQNRDSARQYQPEHQWQPQTERFVTPEFLESLKQQQQQHQLMPENQPFRQPAPRQYMQMQPGSGLPGQGAYSSPSYGAGPANPLYDSPAVSPWGDGSDVLYRGESFPMVPSEALGGFPPMHVPSSGMKNYKSSESGEPIETDEHNVFNPFTFLPNEGSR
jgi:hypothetical protein